VTAEKLPNSAADEMAFYRDQVLLDEYSRMCTGKNEPSIDFTLDTQDWVQDSDGKPS
jgi:hypothetical protein